MAEILSVAPTRSALLELEQMLAQARKGYLLLKRKQEVLMHELLGLADDAGRAQADMQARIQAAVTALMTARMRMGSDRLHWASQAQRAEIESEITMRTIMGVNVPLVQMEVRPMPLAYGLGDTSVTLDEAELRWIEVAEALGYWIETVTTVWRLAQELQRTRRRVNALEHVLIPQYEAAIAHIQSVLEEQEREAFVRAKRVKSLRDGRKEDPDE